MRVCGRVVSSVTPRTLAVVPVVVAVPHLMLLLPLQPVQECGAAQAGDTQPSTRSSPDSEYPLYAVMWMWSSLILTLIQLPLQPSLCRNL